MASALGSGVEASPVAQRQLAGRNSGGYIPNADYAYFDDELDFPSANNIDYITGTLWSFKELWGESNS